MNACCAVTASSLWHAGPVHAMDIPPYVSKKRTRTDTYSCWLPTAGQRVDPKAKPSHAFTTSTKAQIGRPRHSNETSH